MRACRTFVIDNVLDLLNDIKELTDFEGAILDIFRQLGVIEQAMVIAFADKLLRGEE